jgi:hypothetical protein
MRGSNQSARAVPDRQAAPPGMYWHCEIKFSSNEHTSPTRMSRSDRRR